MFDVHAAESRRQPFACLLVLIEDGNGQDDVESVIPPGLKNAPGDAAKENGRKEHVGVEDDPHFFDRTSRTARPTSATFMPERRA